jgi:CBS domain-containing protein
MNDSAPIVVGVDGSTASIHALRWAAGEADRLELPVHAVLAADPRDQFGAVDNADSTLATAVDAAIPAQLRRLRTRLTARVVPGDSVEILTERSHGATLLVLGRAHGTDPLHTSTMAQCMRRAACPVAVIPAMAPDPTYADAVTTDSGRATAGALTDLPVGDVMTRRVLAVTAATGVDAALQLMVGAGVHHLPVTRDGRCVGLLHEADLVWRMAAWQFAEDTPDTGEVARTPPPAVSLTHTIGQAAATMFDSNSDAVVVTDDQHVIGILTTSDLLALLSTDQAATTTS